VIVPDINLLVYAYNTNAPHHEQARGWWESALTADRPIGLAWVVMLGYLRLMTSRRILTEPLAPSHAIRHLRSWLDRPCAQLLVPGPRHLDLIDELMKTGMASGELATDVHLAALAIEHQAELCSNDADFARFPGLRWSNPLR